jgi:hypothetical protein
MTTKLYDILCAIKTLMRTLWLSVSSVGFYEDVYRRYTGYGLKYLFTLSLISSVIYSAVSLNYVTTLRDYFNHNKLTPYTANLEHIIKQLPEISYDGKNIKVEDEETPLFLYNSSEGKIGVVDPNNKLSFNDKSKIPIVFTKSKVIFSFIWDKKKINLPFDYQLIFGSEPQILSSEQVKKHFGQIMSSLPTIFIYVLTPIVVILSFIATLLRASFMVTIIYLVTQAFGPQASIKTCIRMVLFSSGAHTLLEPIINALVPALSGFSWLILTWTSILLFLSILKIRNAS